MTLFYKIFCVFSEERRYSGHTGQNLMISCPVFALLPIDLRSDHFLLINAMALWEEACRNGDSYAFCDDNFLSEDVMKMLLHLKMQFCEYLQEAGLGRKEESRAGLPIYLPFQDQASRVFPKKLSLSHFVATYELFCPDVQYAFIVHNYISSTHSCTCKRANWRS